MNRLAQERSPYLLQHASNPVDWHPWGSDAFDRARREDKPIFLSIGYSTCHWCHVMEHESFENADIAKLLNADFVSIKVDREERPDVDRVYMSFVQSTTGSGGWPMTVFLTPELKPFFGGTYFPPASRWGRPGFSDLLGELARVWKNDRPRVEAAATELLERLKMVTGAGAHGRGESTIAGPEALDAAVESYQNAFDERHGGFGDAPKFPRPSELLLLLREYARRTAAGDLGQTPLRMATDTLRAMAMGGMRDHVGGGFHRYSVDAEWRVPHFEKMLYDQAQLTLAYLEAAQATGDDFYATVAEDTLAYVMRDLTDREGASTRPRTPTACRQNRLAIRRRTNPKARSTSGPMPRLARSPATMQRSCVGDLASSQTATRRRIRRGSSRAATSSTSPSRLKTSPFAPSQTPEAVVDALGRARASLFAVRERRPRPHLDDKVLTAWNGLMIAAFARAARVLAGSATAPRYLAAARRAAGFIKQTLWVESGQRLLRRYRDGEAAIDGYAEDYAYLIHGLLELFQADGDPAWLEWATTLQSVQDRLFWDDADAGWFSTTGNDPSVLLRLKEDYDGAEPAAGSVSVLNLLTLESLVGGGAWIKKAERTLARFGPQSRRRGAGGADAARGALGLARRPHTGRDRRAARSGRHAARCSGRSPGDIVRLPPSFRCGPAPRRRRSRR